MIIVPSVIVIAAAIVGGSVAAPIATAQGGSGMAHRPPAVKPVFTQPVEKPPVNDNVHVHAAVKPVKTPPTKPVPLPHANKVKGVKPVPMPHIKKHHKAVPMPRVDTRTHHGKLVNPESVIREALRKAHAPTFWKHGVYTLIERESGFRVHAENKWDSNAAQGADMRSKGLAQTIGPTFRSYHQAGTSWNIYDPVANVAAAVNYIQDRYGSIHNVQQANPNLPPKGY